MRAVTAPRRIPIGYMLTAAVDDIVPFDPTSFRFEYMSFRNPNPVWRMMQTVLLSRLAPVEPRNVSYSCTPIYVDVEYKEE